MPCSTSTESRIELEIKICRGELQRTSAHVSCLRFRSFLPGPGRPKTAPLFRAIRLCLGPRRRMARPACTDGMTQFPLSRRSFQRRTGGSFMAGSATQTDRFIGLGNRRPHCFRRSRRTAILARASAGDVAQLGAHCRSLASTHPSVHALVLQRSRRARGSGAAQRKRKHPNPRFRPGSRRQLDRPDHPAPAARVGGRDSRHRSPGCVSALRRRCGRRWHCGRQ